MAAISLDAELREQHGKGHNRRLRAQGKLPAVVYGNNQDVVSISIDPKNLTEIIRSHGGVNTIFELNVAGKGKDSVMIRDYQIEPIDHKLLHADLIRIAMDKELELSVHVELQGTPVGVRVGGGMLDFVTRTVDVACLPTDIPETIEFDVSDLDLGDYLRASDLKIPDRVRLLSDEHLVIAHVVAARVEAEPTEEEAVEGETPAAEEDSMQMKTKMLE